jgi:aminomethyltransferase
MTSFFLQTSSGPIRKTVLNQLHRELGGKMVPFAGWEMPLHYKEGIVQSHLWTREKASLFDVSHMGQLRFIFQT